MLLGVAFFVNSGNDALWLPQWRGHFIQVLLRVVQNVPRNLIYRLGSQQFMKLGCRWVIKGGMHVCICCWCFFYSIWDTFENWVEKLMTGFFNIQNHSPVKWVLCKFSICTRGNVIINLLYKAKLWNQMLFMFVYFVGNLIAGALKLE